MRNWISMIIAVALAIGATSVLTAADDAKKISAEEQALQAACKAYVEAVNAGDLDAVVALWAEDADYVTDAGERIEGRAALKKMFNEHLQTMKGKKLAFEIKSLRMIAPGVALEDGVATAASDDDTPASGTRYSAVWKRDGDKWLISSVRDLGGTTAGGNRASPLKGLQWLLGDWHSKTPEVAVQLNCSMVLDGSFLKQKYDVKPANGEAFTVITMIGWDPTKGEIHSWYFDSKGGFGDGYWTRNGNVLEIASTGAIADGRLGTATNVWKYIDENNLVWLSKNRQLEGVPMPDTEVNFTRAGAEIKSSTP